MHLLWKLVVLSVTLTTSPLTARTVNAGEEIQLQDMTLVVPDGWHLSQDAKDASTIILGFKNGSEYITVYVKQGIGMNMRSVFVNGSTVIRDVFDYPRSGYNWRAMQTSKSAPSALAPTFVSAFMTEHAGFTYYGYSRASDASRSFDIVNTFLTHIR